MGINISKIISKNKVLNKVDNIVEDWLGKDTEGIYDKAPIYSYPLNVTDKADSTYMLITIYDNDSNKTNFLPMEANNVSTDIWNRIKGDIKVGFSDKWKKGLKNFGKSVVDDLKSLIKANLKTDWGVDVDDLEHTTALGRWYSGAKDTVKYASDWVNTNLSLSGLFGNTMIGNWLDKYGSPVELSIDTEDLKSLALEKIKDFAGQNKYTKALYKKYLGKNGEEEYMRIEDPAQAGYTIKASIALSLPTTPIAYDSSINIDAQSTQTARAVYDVFSSSASKYNFLREKEGKNKFMSLVNAISTGFTQAGKTLSDAGKETVFTTLLGQGGAALFQGINQKIRDPLYVYMYSAPKNRTFTFKYVFAPANKAELFQIYNAIKLLRFYGAIESSKSKSSGSVRYYTLPGRFQIQFYTNDYENEWFGKTKIMGLTDIKTSIPMDNLSLISNTFDDSGNPPRVIELEMSFAELSVLTRDDINGGY